MLPGNSSSLSGFCLLRFKRRDHNGSQQSHSSCNRQADTGRLARRDGLGADHHEVCKLDHVHGAGVGSKAFIDVGGFLGIFAKAVAVSLLDLDVMRDEDGEVHAVTSWSKDQLKDRLSTPLLNTVRESGLRQASWVRFRSHVGQMSKVWCPSCFFALPGSTEDALDPPNLPVLSA